MWFSFVLYLVFSFLGNSLAYKPVYLIHGVGANDHNNFDNLTQFIKQAHPDTIVHATPLYSGWHSTVRLRKQVEVIGADLVKFSEKYPNGIHLIGHSQGGLIARAILEYFPNHNVQNFISIAAPQAGQYGTNLLEVAFGWNIPKEDVHEIAYTFPGQFVSLANFWRDPHRLDKYYKHVNFLPEINNEKYHKNNETFKQGILNLKYFVLLGSEDDGIIQPWQSTQFGFYDKNEANVSLKDQEYYKKDLFGLKTLDERGSLKLYPVKGVSHVEWVFNFTLVDQYILPYLD